MRLRGRRGQRDAGCSGKTLAHHRTARPIRGPLRATANGPRRPESWWRWKGGSMSGTGVLLCGHGSRDPEAIEEFEVAAAALRARVPDFDFANGYLEFARPTIRDGLALLARRGAQRILAIPGMLFAASHVKNDLPWEMNSFIAENPRIDVRLGRDLGIDPKLLQAAADRIATAADARIPRNESLLVVVGRGTNDPDA